MLSGLLQVLLSVMSDVCCSKLGLLQGLQLDLRRAQASGTVGHDRPYVDLRMNYIVNMCMHIYIYIYIKMHH